jgi:multisubunit Na+/H+ antiporter MnhF subunit
MIAAIWIAVVILGAAVLLGLLRIATATDGASRAVVGDLVFFSGIGVLMLFSIVLESAAIRDVAMLAALLGILATIALSRILTRGQR